MAREGYQWTPIQYAQHDTGHWEIVGIVDTTDFMAHRMTHEGATNV